MDYKKEIKNQLIEIAKDFHNKGWCLASSGSMSFRISRSKMLITPAKVSKASLKPSFFIRASIHKDKFSHGYLAPPPEAMVHSWIYQNFGEVNCVLHNYSASSTQSMKKNNDKVPKWSGYDIQKYIRNINSCFESFKLVTIASTEDFNELITQLDVKKKLIAANYAFLINGLGGGLYCFSQYSSQCRLQLEAIEFLLGVND